MFVIAVFLFRATGLLFRQCVPCFAGFNEGADMFRRLDFESIGPSKFLFESETAAIALPTFVVSETATGAVLAGECSARILEPDGRKRQ
jgi:hypothetical protein